MRNLDSRVAAPRRQHARHLDRCVWRAIKGDCSTFTSSLYTSDSAALVCSRYSTSSSTFKDSNVSRFVRMIIDQSASARLSPLLRRVRDTGPGPFHRSDTQQKRFPKGRGPSRSDPHYCQISFSARLLASIKSCYQHLSQKT